ncbi:MAG TPA: hypothetical protein VE221_07240 [Sphingomicrobium sp.]|jgi:type II secretory pathway pseudopilin PulG|nr:hypothetical protein [Sphingomicrobium sp.]
MHFHLPKPLHGWRAFVGEVGIIVIGVLIALGAESLIQAVHERKIAAEARQNVRAEAAANVGFIRERLSTQACIDRRIADLEALLSRTGEGSLDAQPSWVSRPPTWPFFFGRWQAATASGRNSLFSPDEQGRFTVLYAIFSRFDEQQAREQLVWSQLRALEWWHGPLGPQGRLVFAQALQDAKYLAWDLHYAGTFALQGGEQMHLPRSSAPPELQSICLPITATRADALKRLKDPFGEP